MTPAQLIYRMAIRAERALDSPFNLSSSMVLDRALVRLEVATREVVQRDIRNLFAELEGRAT